MQYRHLFPMVRILLPFMAGIIVCIAISGTLGVPLIIWISLLILSIISGLVHFNKLRFVNRWFFGIIVSLFLFVTGYNSVILHKEILKSDHFANLQTSSTFIAVVDEPFQEKDHSYKTILSVKGLKAGNRIVEAEGQILTYFAKDTIKNPPTEGSVITFSANVQPIGPPQNPGAFDYQKYMASNNVYHQVYLTNFSWSLLENPQGFNLFRSAHKVSKKLIAILKANGLKGKEFAVASALLLGQKDMLDNETLQTYSGSGVMHILCVSGLHVGVIYLIINFLLGFMKKKGSQLYLKTALILITIWAYAVLTGLSPSVMRAATMFSFISIGHASRRYVHIINSLAVSAVFLLLIDPLMICNIGFQLSYLAILGIVFINKPIADLWNPPNRITEYVWSLTAVSIAAQIATAPLAMLYFHQFPLYFIPANLGAIPISFLAIYSGIAVLVTSWAPPVSNLLGIITNNVIYALNYFTGFIEGLPHSVLHISSVYAREAILIYLIILSVVLLFALKKKMFLFFTLGLILMLSVSFSFNEITKQRQKKIIFYSTGKQSAVGFINGKEQIVLADSLLIKDVKAIKFQLDGARSLYGISTSNVFALDTITAYYQHIPEDLTMLRSNGNNFLFHGKRIAIIDSTPKFNGYCKTLKVDYLLIRHNPKLRISELCQFYKPGLIILDGSNSPYKTKKWMAESEKEGLKAYSVKDSGAFIVDL